MLRPFPPENARTSDLAKYQQFSDELLKPVSSLASAAKAGPYNNANLSNLTNLSKELLNQLEESAAAFNQFGGGDDGEDGNAEDDANAAAVSGDVNDIKSGKNKKSEFILATIFKIVPIGVNIAKRGKTIATGFKETAFGIVNFIKNTAMIAGMLWIDTFNFNVQMFFYSFKLILCSIKLIMNCPKCLVFYVIHILILLIIVLLISICFLFDVFLMVKSLVGVGCVESFLLLLTSLEAFDSMVYSNFSFHLIHYPDSINESCYSCSEIMGDTSAMQRAVSSLFNRVFNDIPVYIGGPIGDTITGVGHIFSFLSL